MLPLRVQSGPGSDDSKWILCYPQISSFTWTSPSDCLVWYVTRSVRVLTFAGKPSVYSLSYSQLEKHMYIIWSLNDIVKCMYHCLRKFDRSFNSGHIFLGCGTTLYLMTKLLFWRSDECRVTLHCPLLFGVLVSELHVLVNVPVLVFVFGSMVCQKASKAWATKKHVNQSKL